MFSCQWNSQACNIGLTKMRISRERATILKRQRWHLHFHPYTQQHMWIYLPLQQHPNVILISSLKIPNWEDYYTMQYILNGSNEKIKKLTFDTNQLIKKVKKVKKIKSFKKVKNFEKMKLMWKVLHGTIAITIAPNPNPIIPLHFLNVYLWQIKINF